MEVTIKGNFLHVTASSESINSATNGPNCVSLAIGLLLNIPSSIVKSNVYQKYATAKTEI